MAELTLEQRHARLIGYLDAKVSERDWHAVSDVANDLRVLEALMAPPPKIRPEPCPVSPNGRHESTTSEPGRCYHCGCALFSLDMFRGSVKLGEWRCGAPHIDPACGKVHTCADFPNHPGMHTSVGCDARTMTWR